MLIRAAEVEGARVDVRIRDGRVAQIAASLRPKAGETQIEARGGALLPGLHDHHIHLFALAAAEASVDCGPPAVRDAPALAAALQRRARETDSDWIRGFGYYESVAGSLDRDRLDTWLDDRPLRVQHRTGALWMLNSLAVDELGLDAVRDVPGIERGANGRATGRLFDLDGWVRDRLPAASPPDLAAVGRHLASYGVTGVTDATPTNEATAFRSYSDAIARNALRQRLVAMGRIDSASPPPGVQLGCVKMMLAERALPEFGALCDAIAEAHRNERCVAIHCVTRAELVFAATAYATAGVRAGDRIEHASVAPPDAVDLVADAGLTVVTQPGFLFARGDAYAVDVEAEERRWLYRGRGWLDAGVPLGAGTDAPYASADPWQAMRAAVERRSRNGEVFQSDESLSPEQALALFTTAPDAPGGAARRIVVGADADLCLLDEPWRTARARLSSERVVATVYAGTLSFQRPEAAR